MVSSRVRLTGLAAGLLIAAAACGSAPGTEATSTSPASAGGAAAVDARTATSAADFGGVDKLYEAAKAEGKLHVIALPPDWANYGEILAAFKAKYPGIEIEEETPDASSADEINAVKTRKGQDRALDVLDVGQSFAYSGAAEGLFAPYKVANWDKIPTAQKEANGLWVNDYGGYVSIACDAKKIATCPQTFADLLKPEYKGKVAMNGNPTKAGSAFAGVYAAALANGGSFDDIQPGIDFFKKLKDAGNFNPVETTPATIEKGETQISIDWDYNNAAYAPIMAREGPRLEDRHPHRRQVHLAVRPGHQQGRPPPGRRAAVAGVPLQHRGPEPLPEGLRPPGAAARDDRRRLGRPGRLRRPAAGRRRADVPHGRPGHEGQRSRGLRLGRRGRGLMAGPQ